MLFNRKEERVLVNDWNETYSVANGYIDGYSDGQMKESTYFNCIKIISDSIAKCKIQIKKESLNGFEVDKKHYLNDMLRLRHNDYMSAIDSMKTFVSLAKHYGRAGLYPFKDEKGEIKGLYPVKIVGCIVDNAGLIKGTKNNKILWDIESVEGETFSCFDKDLLVLKDFTLDGIKSKAIKNVAKQTLDTSIKAQNHLNSMFTNGLTNKLVVQTTSDIKDKSELGKLQAKFDALYSATGKVFTVPVGYTVQPLNMSLADSQFVELRKLSKEEIASCFQVPLSKLGIRNETAISEESDNIKFLSDCLDVIFTQIEQEMNYKLLTTTERENGYTIKFNVMSMLRLDSITQANVVTTYVKNGVYTPNEGREIIGKNKLINGDEIFMPSGQVSMSALVNGDVSYQKSSEVLK